MRSMYLDTILGSKTKVNILAELLENSDKEFMESELAENINSSLSEVNRQINDLVACGLVSMKRIGRAKIYSINKKHFLFSSLKKLFQNINKIFRDIAYEISDNITKRYKVDAVILFGSVARKEVRNDLIKEPSDVDIVIISKNNIKEIKKDAESFINHDILAKYGIISYPIVISKEEYLRRLKNDRFVIDIHANGEEIYGKKPTRFD